MHFSTIILLACVIATVMASARYESPAEEMLSGNDNLSAYQTRYVASEHGRSPRMKRGLLLLKKKLLLGALGLKAAKVGAVGAGLAGALALKSKASVPHEKIHIYYH